MRGTPGRLYMQNHGGWADWDGFGTATGQVWIGREGGEEWECLFGSLPPIHSMKVAVA